LYVGLQTLIQPILDGWEKNSHDKWQWFEKDMTYDNGILPMAILHAAETTGNEKWKEIGLQSLTFLENLTMSKGYFTPVGNEGWHCDGGDCPLFDQQAIETMAMVMLYQQAHAVTGNKIYLQRMYTCYKWFLGDNALRIPLYDTETHGCCDGLEARGLNRNQGAESTLAYFISHLSVLKSCEAIPKPEKIIKTAVISAGMVTKII
jgi:hypothetical protein